MFSRPALVSVASESRLASLSRDQNVKNKIYISYYEEKSADNVDKFLQQERMSCGDPSLQLLQGITKKVHMQYAEYGGRLFVVPTHARKRTCVDAIVWIHHELF